MTAEHILITRSERAIARALANGADTKEIAYAAHAVYWKELSLMKSAFDKLYRYSQALRENPGQTVNEGLNHLSIKTAEGRRFWWAS